MSGRPDNYGSARVIKEQIAGNRHAVQAARILPCRERVLAQGEGDSLAAGPRNDPGVFQRGAAHVKRIVLPARFGRRLGSRPSY